MVSEPNDVPQWIVDARTAREQLAGVREGQREATLRSLFDGKKANTVRRWIAALSFIETLQPKHPALAIRLMCAPFTIVELFGRWYAFDPDGAIVAMRSWEREGGSFRTIGIGLAEARESKRAPSVRTEENAYRKRMRDSVKRLVARRLGGAKIDPPLLNFKDSELPPADYLFRSAGPGRKSVQAVVLVVGPFSNPEMYVRRLPDLVAKAFAFAWLYDMVILLVTERSCVKDYEEAVASLQLRVRSVHARKPSIEVVNLSDNPGPVKS